MATGEDRITLEDLLKSLETVKFNQSDNTTSEKIQKNDKDLAITLWKKIEKDTGNASIINTTFEEFSTLLNEDNLIIGSSYIFNYETIHDILTYGGTNKSYYQQQGQVNRVEPLMVKAVATNKISHKAISLLNPSDVVYYEPTPVSLSSGQVNKGTIYRRIDTVKNIDVPFDFRNYLVARLSIDFQNVPDLTSTPQFSFGKFNSFYAFQVLDNSPYSQSPFSYIPIDENTTIGGDITNLQFKNILPLSFPLGIFPQRTTPPEILPSIDIDTCSNIKVNSIFNNESTVLELQQLSSSLDLLFKNCNDVNIEGLVSSCTFVKCNGIKLKDKNYSLVLVDTGQIKIGSDNFNGFLTSTYNSIVGGSNNNFTLCSTHGSEIGSFNTAFRAAGGGSLAAIRAGSKNSNIYLSGDTSIGNNNTEVLLESCRRVYLKDRNSNISLRACLNIRADSEFTNIEYMNIGNDEPGNGVFVNCIIGFSVDSIIMPNGGNIVNTYIGNNFKNVTLNSEVQDSYFCDNIQNLELTKAPSTSTIRARFLNSLLSSAVITLPDSESNSYYFVEDVLPVIVKPIEQQVVNNIFPISAEESGDLNVNSFEWSYGNGAEGDIGIILPFACEVVGFTLDCESEGTDVEIQLIKNGNTFNTFSFTTGGIATISSPLVYDIGDKVGFRTGNITGTYNNCRVTVWFKSL